VKLLSLVANRVATLDPFGVGLEMESDKPGWNDSMNGLPGLLGSSLGETLQLLRACRFLASAMARIMPGRNDPNDRVRLFEELARFIKTLDGQLTRRLRSRAGNRALAFWRASHNAKELYREQTRMGVSGREVEVPAGDLRAFLDRCTALLEQIFAGPGRERILSPEGVPYTYFINEVTRWKPLVEGKGRQARPRLSSLGNPLVEPLAFEQRPVALFLEGPMHYLKVRGGEEAQAVYGAVRQSALFDRKLRMYRSCEPLTAEPFEIGRVGVYPRGWIENESIYLHMEYKYLLEVLRAGLHREFFRDLQTMLVCFLDPKTYGRSVLEGASFITSSANRDPGLHGQAFQPRQSGITCEMIHLWTVMVAGERPFGLDHAGRLTLRLRPVLARSFFTDAPSTAQGLELPAGAFAFRFLGRTLVVYHNPSRRDTFGVSGAEPRRYRLTYADGCLLTVDGALLEEQPARDVREGRVERLDVELG
jgi:hypothetical protein